ncbi:hypothetical protein [Tabrizicola sp. BL-A-41-H6]|uniref:hypothetical protein n=1 Tax=Tabrizicola sp. BL-A-41-H6 TaxID=3421107 RepID=UPI003D66F3ED
MLHVVNLDLMRASARYHTDGSALDPHEPHRREVVLHLRRTRHAARMARLARLGTLLRKLVLTARPGGRGGKSLTRGKSVLVTH